MTFFWSIILGVVQGLTEFLPVSSSGHLAILQSLIPNFSQPGVVFDVTLHLATTLAVIYFFRQSILKLKAKYILLLIVGTIPAVVVGFLFKDFIEPLFGSVALVGTALLVSSLLNFLTDRQTAKIKIPSFLDSLIIGFFQAIAIIPGLSRSGSTIFAGSSLGVDKKEAAKFSFLLSVPAVLGANALEIYSHSSEIENIDYFVYGAGFLAAFITGYLAIKVVIDLLAKNKFRIFAVYCLLLGGAALFFLK